MQDLNEPTACPFCDKKPVFRRRTVDNKPWWGDIVACCSEADEKLLNPPYYRLPLKSQLTSEGKAVQYWNKLVADYLDSN